MNWPAGGVVRRGVAAGRDDYPEYLPGSAPDSQQSCRSGRIRPVVTSARPPGTPSAPSPPRVPADPATFALLLIHEFQHVKLGAILDLFDLYDQNDHPSLLRSWRPDPRPLEGLLQGTYAHIAVADFWRSATPSCEPDPARHEFARWRAQTAEAIETLTGQRCAHRPRRRFRVPDGRHPHSLARRGAPPRRRGAGACRLGGPFGRPSSHGRDTPVRRVRPLRCFLLAVISLPSPHPRSGSTVALRGTITSGNWWEFTDVILMTASSQFADCRDAGLAPRLVRPEGDFPLIWMRRNRRDPGNLVPSGTLPLEGSDSYSEQEEGGDGAAVSTPRPPGGPIFSSATLTRPTATTRRTGGSRSSSKTCATTSSRLTDLPDPSMAGFMDTGLLTGHLWHQRLAEALATCRVFVPLYFRATSSARTAVASGPPSSQRLDSQAGLEAAVPKAIIPAPVDTDAAGSAAPGRPLDPVRPRGTGFALP